MYARILQLLKDNNGDLDLAEVCTIMGATYGYGDDYNRVAEAYFDALDAFNINYVHPRVIDRGNNRGSFKGLCVGMGF